MIKPSKSWANRSCHPNTKLSTEQLEEEDLQLQAETTARVLTEVAQAQQKLRDSVQRLEVQLQGAWLGPARQEFEALKVRGTGPWEDWPELSSEP